MSRRSATFFAVPPTALPPSSSFAIGALPVRDSSARPPRKRSRVLEDPHFRNTPIDLPLEVCSANRPHAPLGADLGAHSFLFHSRFHSAKPSVACSRTRRWRTKRS